MPSIEQCRSMVCLGWLKLPNTQETVFLHLMYKPKVSFRKAIKFALTIFTEKWRLMSIIIYHFDASENVYKTSYRTLSHKEMQSQQPVLVQILSHLSAFPHALSSYLCRMCMMQKALHRTWTQPSFMCVICTHSTEMSKSAQKHLHFETVAFSLSPSLWLFPLLLF